MDASVSQAAGSVPPSRQRSSGVPGCSSSSHASSLGFDVPFDAALVEQVVLDPHIVHAPLHPIALSALQRGQRTSGDSNPQLGHVGSIVIAYTTPSSRAIKPPIRKATPMDPANRPAK